MKVGNWLLENYSTAQGTEQGSQTRVYDFLVRTVEKNARLVCLCYSVPQVSFVLHCWVKQRTLRFEKAARRQRKIYLMKKATMLHSRMSRRFANLLNNEQ